MTVKVPVRSVFNNSGDAIGLSEFQVGETINYLHGGTGLTVLGTPNQVLKVNSQGTAIVWAADAESNLNPYLEVANANITFVTKSVALTSNNALKILINDRMQVANVNQTFVTKSTALTSNNNLKVLIDDRIQVANVNILLATKAANTYVNQTFVTKSVALTSNNALKILINDRMQVANAVSLFQTISNAQANLANTNASIATRLAANATISLSGVLSGSASFNNNSISVNAQLTSSGTPVGTFGSASLVPVITVGADGRITNISNTAVAGVNSISFNNANGLFTINTSDGGSRTANITLQPFSTTNLTEGTNQYFTVTRARQSFTAGSGIVISQGVISQATQIDYGLITGAVGANTIDYGSID